MKGEVNESARGPLVLEDLEDGNGDLFRELYLELRKSLGSFTEAQAEAIRRLKWVAENHDRDPALIRNNLGKGLNAIAPDKTPKFF